MTPSPDDTKQGISKIRNPVITRVFRELDLAEQWGSGVRRIVSEVEAQGLPELEIVEIGMRLRVVVPLEGLLETGAQSGAQSEAVIHALSAKALSSAEIAASLKLETKSGALKRTLKELLEAALIEYTLPDKPNSRMQKYRLTKEGRALLHKGRDLLHKEGPQP